MVAQLLGRLKLAGWLAGWLVGLVGSVSGRAWADSVVGLHSKAADSKGTGSKSLREQQATNPSTNHQLLTPDQPAFNSHQTNNDKPKPTKQQSTKPNQPTPVQRPHTKPNQLNSSQPLTTQPNQPTNKQTDPTRFCASQDNSSDRVGLVVGWCMVRG